MRTRGTVVLFQFKARIIASAVFLRDEKFERAKGGHAGAIYIDASSIRTFDPLDVEAMRKVWPRFRAFGHVKQHLNPTLYPALKRRLTNVATGKSGHRNNSRKMTHAPARAADLARRAASP